MAELGSGDYTYAGAAGWGQLPEGWSFKEGTTTAAGHPVAGPARPPY